MKKIDLAGIGKLSRQRLSTVLREVKGGCITSKNVATILKVSVPKARSFISSWSANGWLIRMRRGVYFPVDLAATFKDHLLIDPWILAHELYAPCYIGGWSAAQYWGFTEQIFEATLVITPRHIERKRQAVGDLVFLIKKIRPNKMFGLKAVWKEQLKVHVSDPHKTMIDMFDDPSIGGGIRSVIDLFSEYISSSHYNTEALLEYVSKMNNKSIYKRLGFVLSKVKPNAHGLIDHCKQNISKGNSQLDPNLKGPRLLKKWNLWIPEDFEKHMNWTKYD